MKANPTALAGLALVAAALLTLTACNGQRTVAPPDKPDEGAPSEPAVKPTLAVLVVVDQLRGDYPSRWRSLFGEGGFERLATEGAWFQSCYYPYAHTVTAAGHATCATGCSPDVHGVIGNEWFDSARGKEVHCVLTTRYKMVPVPVSGKDDKGASPDFLLAPTIGDALKKATGGKGKIVALTLKDRSAVLPAGKSVDTSDAVYWTDKDGRFVTSTNYRDAVHDWVKAYNASGEADRWLDKQWTKSRDDVDYVKWAGPDDVASEADVYGMGRTFPHPLSLGKGKSKGKRNYYDAMTTSPMGNDWLLGLVLRAIEAEKLGSRPTPDLLTISFSSNDLVGHAFGPDSQEVLDVTLRTDVVLRKLMNCLDEKVGKGKWVLALTADHGVSQVPELAKAKGKDARRFPAGPMLDRAEDHLNKVFGPNEAEALFAGRWIEHLASSSLYLNHRRIETQEVKAADVARELAAWATKQPGIQKAYTREQIEGPMTETDPILQMVKRSYHPRRSGDVTVVLKPYHVLNWDKGGTTHGTPHEYDRHVPLMVIGPGIEPGVRETEQTSPEHAAVILAASLGIAAPEKAAVQVPKGLFRGR